MLQCFCIFSIDFQLTKTLWHITINKVFFLLKFNIVPLLCCILYNYFMLYAVASGDSNGAGERTTGEEN